MSTRRMAVALAAAVVLLTGSTARSDVPQQMNFQGILLDTGGGVVEDSTYSLTFGIYDDSTGGSLHWSETQMVTTENGLFNTFLGQTTPVPDTTFNGTNRWLEIDLVGFGPYLPRTRLGSVAYAYRVASVHGATGGDIYGNIQLHSTLTIGETNEGSSGVLQVTNGASTSILIDGESSLVGIGTNDPAENLHVQGTGLITTSLSVGIGNSTTQDHGFTAGMSNTAGDTCASVSGGASNLAAASMSTVGGGTENVALAYGTTVAGGRDNDALQTYGTVGGGLLNESTSSYATVGGGRSNSAAGQYSSCLGGYFTAATANFATTVGGYQNEATDTSAFAAGYRAKAQHPGSFVWADQTNYDFGSSASNQFSARCTGGARFVTAVNFLGFPVSGVTLAGGGGSWSSISDRNAKEEFEPIDGADLLRRLAAMPITTWKYKSQDRTIRHIGPMAQDFHNAFKVGEDDRHITAIDGDGVALAAIQELYRQAQARDVELRTEIQRLNEIIERLTQDAK